MKHSLRIPILVLTLALLLGAVLLLAGCNGKPAPVEVTAEGQTLGLEGVSNARELGGYVGAKGKAVRHGMLFRTGKLGDATENDLAALNALNLGKVIDLRTTSEIESVPNPTLDGVTNVRVAILDESADDNDSAYAAVAANYAAAADKVQAMIEMIQADVMTDATYTDYVTNDYCIAAWRTFFDELLAAEGKPVLWHCTSGKDRTGFASVLVLTALGVDEETILKDFALTNEFYASSLGYMKNAIAERTDDEAVLSKINAYIGVEPAFMEKAISLAKEKYGSVEGYLKQAVGVTDDEIKTLRGWYLED